MVDHWWWRPGWHKGIRFYAFHLTFGGTDQADVQRLMGAYRTALAGLPDLDLVPDRWLHLTMQGLGFADRLTDHQVDTVIQAARSALAAIPPFEVRLAAPVITPEAIESFAEPAEPVAAVRNAIRGAIRQVMDVPEPADGFLPHVSIAYSNGTLPYAIAQAALDNVTAVPATARITHANLIEMHRDNMMYEWENYASIYLG